MNLAVHTRQEAAADLARSIAQEEATPAAVTLCAQKWLNHRREVEGSPYHWYGAGRGPG